MTDLSHGFILLAKLMFIYLSLNENNESMQTNLNIGMDVNDWKLLWNLRTIFKSLIYCSSVVINVSQVAKSKITSLLNSFYQVYVQSIEKFLGIFKSNIDCSSRLTSQSIARDTFLVLFQWWRWRCNSFYVNYFSFSQARVSYTSSAKTEKSLFVL